ncbi:hypothetical protein [Thalassococcus lentus]|uniref:Uncharacterized protein n=1 Tax=Thalassococcus lentus TaxID=1210524 RepID=A0ABT4XRD0_9RHOB|nr:hypothetical protein [Thalassococcus lentus]MDA7424495.1 hypothetical protein [Thalassococcus lentus]
MTTFAKTALIALTVAAGALGVTSAAQAETVEIITAIGFGETQTYATVEAVRAWVIEATQMYGNGDWNTAFRTEMDCFKQGSSQYTTNSIVIGGDVTAAWSCTVKGIPLAAIQG